MSSSVTSASVATRWIFSPAYDLSLIFAPAPGSILLACLLVYSPALLPLAFWGWAILIDGTHLWATFSRTYCDTEYFRNHRPLLLGSLGFIIVPPLIFGLAQATHTPDIVDGVLLFAQTWSYYHILRQHYGFVSLYDRRAGRSPREHNRNRLALYLGLGLPYLCFIFTHPLNRRIAREAGVEIFTDPWIFALFFQACVFVSSLLILNYLIRLVRDLRASLAEGPTRAPVGDVFLLVCVLAYSLIFYLFSYFEPLLPGAITAGEQFMLVTIMISLFHGIQYHGIVWKFNQREYGAGLTDDRSGPLKIKHGPAVFFNRTIARYTLFALIFSGMYAWFNWQTGEYPSLSGISSGGEFTPLALGLYWGFSFHHFYLDQKIWRFSRSPELRNIRRTD